MGAHQNERYAARAVFALAGGGDVVEMDDVIESRARSIRDRHYGSRMTYSPKVFHPRHPAVSGCVSLLYFRQDAFAVGFALSERR